MGVAVWLWGWRVGLWHQDYSREEEPAGDAPEQCNVKIRPYVTSVRGSFLKILRIVE